MTQKGDVRAVTRLYWELKTGAETGWDYSSRWTVKNGGGNTDDLADTKVRNIVPVDLNAFLEKNARILAGYFQRLGEEEAAEEFTLVAADLALAIDDVLWNDEEGVWNDFDTINGCLRPYFTPSNLVPLWTESFVDNTRTNRCSRAVHYLAKQNLQDFPGGLPTTFFQSGQQWDMPNAWPPLEHMVVHGLRKSGLPEAQSLAFSIAQRRVRGAFLNFVAKEHMFEKYDCTSTERIGGGGEYEIQIGFGWSNGVVLDFLHTYGDVLSCEDQVPLVIVPKAEPTISDEGVASESDSDESVSMSDTTASPRDSTLSVRKNSIVRMTSIVSLDSGNASSSEDSSASTP